MFEDDKRNDLNTRDVWLRNMADDWLPTLIGALVAMSTSLIAIIILFFFHGM